MLNMTVSIIAEIGSNWEGDVELGKMHIKRAKESGASYVKFQMWRAKDLYSEDHQHWDSIKKSELTENIAKELKQYADRIGIKWFCSVFNPEAVDFLESINVSMYKIASWTTALKHKFALETIKKVAETKKQTFISTGYGIRKEVIEKEFENNTFQYVYCISNYPTLDNEINWKEILKFNFFSDHTLGITIPLTYVILQHSRTKNDLFIEKHVKFDNSTGPDASFSITYDELHDLGKHIERIVQLNI